MMISTTSAKTPKMPATIATLSRKKATAIRMIRPSSTRAYDKATPLVQVAARDATPTALDRPNVRPASLGFHVIDMIIAGAGPKQASCWEPCSARARSARAVSGAASSPLSRR
jgi:hypothetical protein